MAKRILVIDDERDYRDILAHILEDARYEVRSAVNGEDGMARLSAEKPDMVLLDLNLPDTDGYEMCRRIRADREHGHVPIIMITIQSQVPNIVKGLKEGADDYIMKPFNPEEVLARVAALFRQAGRA